jgi:hypothetical protein
MEQDAFHLPDAERHDFSQPVLTSTDLSQPDFVLPDPAVSDLQRAGERLLWPEDLSRPEVNRPDPASPDLLQVDRPGLLSYPVTNAPMLPEPENAPEVVMSQRPAELDPAARSMVLTGPDEATLPPHLAYPQLYTNDHEMSWRKRHFAMLASGLEQSAGDAHGD